MIRSIILIALGLGLVTLASADRCAQFNEGAKVCSETAQDPDGGYSCTCTTQAKPTFTDVTPRSQLPSQFHIKGVGSGRCVDVSGNSQNNMQLINIYDCVGVKNQLWAAKSVGNGYNFVAQHSGKCLTIRNNNVFNGEKIVQWECNGHSNQVWQFENPDGQNSKIKNPTSGRCLDVENGANANNVNIIIYDCHGHANQRWSVY